MFSVVCSEIGYPENEPYHSSDDKEECEHVCSIVAERYNARAFVVKDGRKIYLSNFSGWNKFLHVRKYYP